MTAYSKRPEAPDDLYRVFRGGSWYNSTAVVVRAANRYGVTPTYRYFNFGFRTVQTGCRQVLVNP